MLEVADLVVRYGPVAAVDGVSLEVADGQVVAVLGPSGCGKSSLLRAITGLVRPERGVIRWSGQDLAGVPVHRRRFGLMFQDHALFPHLDVAGNVGFGLRMQGHGRGETAVRVEEVLRLVGLEGFGSRSVRELSGGEQQRVALARALAPRPRLLLLDEPLGSLDRSLRDRLVAELPEVFSAVGAAVVYVTHDQDEALALADSLVIMREGRIVQSGEPAEVWSRPASAFVARFLGASNLIVADRADGRVELPWVDLEHDGADGPVEVVVRPDAAEPDEAGRLRGVVVSRSYRGDHFLGRVRPTEGPELDLELRWVPVPDVGEQVRLRLDPQRILVLDSAEPHRSR